VCRIPDHPFALEIIKSVGLPIAAPSANTSGRMSATTAEMVEQDLGDKIDGIIDGGASRVGIESTIVDGRNTQKITILRPGIIGKLELEKFFQEAYKAGELSGLVGVEEFSKHISTEIVPGSKYRHYAPRTPLYEIKQLEDITDDGICAVIATKEQLESIGVFDKKIFKQGNIHYLCVGSRNSLEEIVKNMYNIFFVLDTLSLSKAYILTEEWGTSSLAKALENRLRKVLL
jgi:L-threonylcarbamoyladenylate synthase